MNIYLQTFLIAIAVALIALGLYYLISYIIDSTRKLSNPSNFYRIKQEQESAIIRIPPQNKKPLSQILNGVPKNQQVLANFSVLTAFNPGYIGPYADGVYSESVGTNTALELGARCFVIPIDSDSTWKRPMMVQRNTSGNRISLDSFKMDGQRPVGFFGGDPAEVINTLARNAFAYTNDPLIIYLHFEKTPDPVSKEKEYISFLSKVAAMLKPLREFHLRSTERGDYTRQRSTDSLLIVPIQMYMKKVLIFTNVDTSVFRKKAYSENEDLDFWTHMRFYDSVSTKDSKTVRAYFNRPSFYLNTPPNKIGELVDNTRINFNMALSKEKSVTLADAKTLLETQGVQLIPIGLFEPENKPVADLYKNGSFLVKPEALRFTIPEPIKVAAQNPKLNSNGGILSTPQIPM